jgi:hypothetical protein
VVAVEQVEQPVYLRDGHFGQHGLASTAAADLIGSFIWVRTAWFHQMASLGLGQLGASDVRYCKGGTGDEARAMTARQMLWLIAWIAIGLLAFFAIVIAILIATYSRVRGD